MRKKYSLEIAGIHFNVYTDMQESEVNKIVSRVNKDVCDLVYSSVGMRKTEALLIKALDYAEENEKLKAEIAKLRKGEQA